MCKEATRGPFLESSKKFLGPKKPFEKLRPAYSVKLVFSYVVKGIKIKIIIVKFRASRGLRFEDTKRIMSPEIRPKSFGTFKKQASDQVLNPYLSTEAEPPTTAAMGLCIILYIVLFFIKIN